MSNATAWDARARVDIDLLRVDGAFVIILALRLLELAGRALCPTALPALRPSAADVKGVVAPQKPLQRLRVRDGAKSSLCKDASPEEWQARERERERERERRRRPSFALSPNLAFRRTKEAETHTRRARGPAWHRS